jgi:hypothetical protein
MPWTRSESRIALGWSLLFCKSRSRLNPRKTALGLTMPRLLRLQDREDRPFTGSLGQRRHSRGVGLSTLHPLVRCTRLKV